MAQKPIGIRIETYNELKQMKAEGQSFDGFIQELIGLYKRNKEIMEGCDKK